MNRKVFFILLSILLIAGIVVFMTNLNTLSENENGIAIFEIYDELDNKTINNASIVIMDKEKVFKTNIDGKSVIRLESKPNTPKEFLGYTAMIIADGYLPTIVYNIGVYPAKKSEDAMKYTIKLKKPEAFSNVSYYTEFLPTSNTEMAGIIEYYKSLIK